MIGKTLKISTTGGGILAIALTVGAFAYIPSSGAAVGTTHGAAPALPSLRPGSPAHVPGGMAQATASLTSSVTSVQSTNWAGYAAYNGTTTFRLVSAHFTVPYLDCHDVPATNSAWSSHWVGLDGFNSPSVEQTGLLTGCEGTTPVYAAWWEMYPNMPGYPSIAVHPGNQVNLSVFYSSSTHKFTLKFSDTTNGQAFSRTVSCPSGVSCHRNSAEVISEAPFDTSTNAFTALSDFQAVSFAKVHLTNTSGTHSGGLTSSAWGTFRITQVSDGTNSDLLGNPIPSGTALDRPTPLYQSTSFLDYWMPANAG